MRRHARGRWSARDVSGSRPATGRCLESTSTSRRRQPGGSISPSRSKRARVTNWRCVASCWKPRWPGTTNTTRAMRRACAASRSRRAVAPGSSRCSSTWPQNSVSKRPGAIPGRSGASASAPKDSMVEAAGTGVSHRVGVDLEAGRAWRQHRQQVSGAAAEIQRRPAAQASMAPQVELPHQAPQTAALDLSLQVNGVEGNRHGW